MPDAKNWKPYTECWKAFDGWEQKYLIEPMIEQVKTVADPCQIIGKERRYVNGFVSDGGFRRHGWSGKIRLCEIETIGGGATKLVLRIKIVKWTNYGGPGFSASEPWDGTEGKIIVLISGENYEIKRIWSKSSYNITNLKEKIREIGEELIW